MPRLQASQLVGLVRSVEPLVTHMVSIAHGECSAKRLMAIDVDHPIGISAVCANEEVPQCHNLV